MPIYLDNGATSYPKPDEVCGAMIEYMTHNGASPGRGNYARAMDADKLVYETRKALSKLLGAPRPGQIIFTCNATESINMALKGYLRPGDRVLTTGYEHNAVARPLKKLETERGIRVELIPCAPDGTLDLSAMRSLLDGGTRLVAAAHGSNVIGCITPLGEVVGTAHERGVPVLADAAQTAGAYPIDAAALQIDMLAFTGHKGLLGPTGTGGLYLREGVVLSTLKEGGTGGMSLSPFPPDDPPDRYEAGTMNVAGIAGLRAAVSYLMGVGVDAVRRHEVELTGILLDGLDSVPGLTYYGPRDTEDRLGLVSFNIEGRDPHKVSMSLDRDYGIMVRSGLHCAPSAHRLLGTAPVGAVRASLGYFSDREDVERLVRALKEISSRGE
ncbi:MAG: aminotransferase class V-fold PLP-dependent enzyme [Synergistaceae bacterium]|jgi:cysteine desulfurase family protein|nr:aminotransferase class V-fold PLP-dependent enzyme [Synergistaceae bacterium]